MMRILLSLIALSATLVRASDDEYLRSLQDDFLADNANNGTCSPTVDPIGIECNGTVLQQSKIFGDFLVLKANTSGSFDDQTRLFTSTANVYGSLGNISNVPIMSFKFNSSTPNGTVISSGRAPIGPLQLKTGNIFVPTIPMLFELSHEATLLRDEDIACNPDTICDKARVVGTVGLFATGQQIQPLSQVIINITEPNAGSFVFPFAHQINSTTFCENETYLIDYRDTLGATVKVCIGALPCYDQHPSLPVSNFNGTIADNVCTSTQGS